MCGRGSGATMTKGKYHQLPYLILHYDFRAATTIIIGIRQKISSVDNQQVIQSKSQVTHITL
jgi:hypothetical protein